MYQVSPCQKRKSASPVRCNVLKCAELCAFIRLLTKTNFFKANWSRDAATVLTFNNCTFCPHCIYVFCIYLRKNSDLCHLQNKLIGFYNRDKKFLHRGTDWVFK